MSTSMRQPNPMTRRGFLAVSAVGSLGALAACGNGKGVGDTNAQGVGNFTGGDYNGPPITLSYWNGFTGGGGPALGALGQRFHKQKKKKTGKQKTTPWGALRQRAPPPPEAGEGPEQGGKT